ncbi:hypothetical protein N7478_013039 [Penicillium angulare]|uniref:uncharacterized protein n=1 Tax=Penicillium angulare TaxID=116970 RepID=UPI0025402327|nr:uncharacterized protein N7478_013039 [Penicillium angulare]KAJ5256935.1 hypothetical protein N7478_013039 [Penicillium angulare]
MRNLLLQALLAVWMACMVSAYGNYGAYERVMFWYAYQIDCDIHGGLSQIVAPACSRKGRCTFEQFMKYIEKSQPNVTPRGIANNLGVDEMAGKLYDQGFKGKYDGTHIIEGESDDEQTTARIFKTIAQKFRKEAFINDAKEKSMENYKSMRTASQRVHFLRNIEFADDLKAGLENKGYTVKTKSKQLTSDANSQKADFVNVKATRQANSNMSEKDWEDLFDGFVGKKGNDKKWGKMNIHSQVLQSAKEVMLGIRTCSNN